jgi:hypothetical protein
MQVDANFLCDKTAMLDERIKETPCVVFCTLVVFKVFKNEFNETQNGTFQIRFHRRLVLELSNFLLGAYHSLTVIDFLFNAHALMGVNGTYLASTSLRSGARLSATN